MCANRMQTTMKWRVEIQRPILPPNHPAGAPLPERIALEVGEYVVEASDRTAVIEMFHAAQASGLEHLKGRTIRAIAPFLNGREPGGSES